MTNALSFLGVYRETEDSAGKQGRDVPEVQRRRSSGYTDQAFRSHHSSPGPGAGTTQLLFFTVVCI